MNEHREPPSAAGSDPVERGLDALSSTPGEVPMGEALRAELARLQPVSPRRPRRQLVLLVALSLLYAGGLVALTGTRGDGIDGGSLAYAVAWLASFATLAWLVVVPPRGAIMPRWRRAGALGAAFAIAFVGGGLALGGEPAAGADAAAGLGRGLVCVELGLVAALVPTALAALLVRGSLPVGRPWAAAALGAAGGSLGGLVLELHCPMGDRLHLGLGHGGVVVLSALLAAAMTAAPALVRARNRA